MGRHIGNGGFAAPLTLRLLSVPPSSRSPARRTRTAAPRSFAGGRPAAGAPRSASPAGDAASAACATPCAAPARPAATGSAPPRSLPMELPRWMRWALRFCPDGHLRLPGSPLPKVRKGTSACARQTARPDSAAPVTSGPKSANRCCGKGRCVPGTGGKAPTAWRSSSGASAPRGWRVGCSESRAPPTPPACTPASGSEQRRTDTRTGRTPAPPEQKVVSQGNYF
ncbi:hypothetical protein Q9966_001346 [Columba livia]|nr:hypothetical protein Q9966_001346 [Columba livia]